MNEITVAKTNAAVLESMGDGLVAINLSGKIIAINAQAESMLGMRKSDVLGRPHTDAWVLEDAEGNPVPGDQRPLQVALRTGKKVTIKATSNSYWCTRSWHNKKRRFPAGLTATPVWLGDTVIGAVAVLRDISREWEIDQSKSEFIALVSHQLRTPPTIINWTIESLLSDISDQLTVKQRELFDDIQRSNQRMMELIDSFLDLSRISTAIFWAHSEPVDLAEMVGDIAHDELELLIRSKRLHVVLAVPKNHPVINANAVLLRIVLLNLLANAVKYTPAQGRIKLHLGYVGKHKQPGITLQAGDYLIEVADTGCGIPADQQGKIFTRFFRAKNAKSHSLGGTGLGLYFVKSILSNAGGNIWFKSKENQGTTFFVTLPCSETA